MKITQMHNGAIVETPQVCFTYQVAETPRDFNTRANSSMLHWNNIQNYIGEFIIYPYGTSNDLPQVIKDVVDNSSNVPGFLLRKTELLWGGGPKLYREGLVDGIDVRIRENSSTIQKWLESIRYEYLLLKGTVDYQHVQATMTRFETNKGTRIGKPFFNKLHHIQPDKGRLARLRNSLTNDPTHIVTSTWNFNHVNAIAESRAYPIFDFGNPFANENSILHSNMYTFCTDYYNVPGLYGTLEWIRRSSAVPLIFKAHSMHSINLKYHVTSPAAFWDKKRAALKAQKESAGEKYTEEDFLIYEKEFLLQVTKVLSGDENAGKFLHTTSTLSVKGHELVSEGWEVKVIDQKVLDFVKSQIEISDKADKVIASSVGVHPVLANITDSGRANSGSEQIYALLNYLNTGVDIQEMQICKAINAAIQYNFPESGLKIGFFQKVPELQSQTSPSNRTKPEPK